MLNVSSFRSGVTSRLSVSNAVDFFHSLNTSFSCSQQNLTQNLKQLLQFPSYKLLTSGSYTAPTLHAFRWHAVHTENSPISPQHRYP